MGNHLSDGDGGGEAQIGGTGRRIGGFRLEFVTDLMQIDLLITEAQRPPPTAKGDGLHPQHALVKSTGSLNIGDGQDKVVEAVNMHS